MSWVIIAVIILTLTLMVFFLSHLKLYINIHIINSAFEYQLNLKLYGIVIYRREKKFNSNQDPDYIENLIDKIDSGNMRQFLSSFGKRKISLIKSCYIRELVWQTDMGAKEASATAILTGVLWTIKGAILALMDTYVKDYDKPKLNITPHFNTYKLETNFTCMISIRLGQAIIRTFKM